MKQPVVKIENEETLIRDTKTNAVLNTDMTALQQYRAKRNRDRQMMDDVENLKKDMSEIKELLQQLVSRD
jgi:predicted class III extradiol MEMO1 family dioxygenase